MVKLTLVLTGIENSFVFLVVAIFAVWKLHDVMIKKNHADCWEDSKNREKFEINSIQIKLEGDCFFNKHVYLFSGNTCGEQSKHYQLERNKQKTCKTQVWKGYHFI